MHEKPSRLRHASACLLALWVLLAAAPLGAAPQDIDTLVARLAAAYLAKKDLKTSLRYVKEVLAVQPKNVPAIINLGLIDQANFALGIGQGDPQLPP